MCGVFSLGPTVDKLLNLSSQLLTKTGEQLATSLAIIAQALQALQDMAGQGQDAEPDDSPAQSVYLDD